MRSRRFACLLVVIPLAVALALWADPQRRKKKEEGPPLEPVLEPLDPKTKKRRSEDVTQTLEILADPPAVLTAETRKLVFHLAPLSAKGLLSQQVRDGIRALWRINRGASIVKLRAFVAGTGDMRRVRDVVSEVFSERRLPLPVLSVVQVGALPMEGAQVSLESVSAAKKAAHPHGLAFISGQAISQQEEMLNVAPLAAQSVEQLRKAVGGIGLHARDILRVTCFCSSLADIDAVRKLVAMEYPQAALNYVQLQRGHTRGLVECEAVARLGAAPGAPLKLVNPPGLAQSPNYSQVALVGAPRVVLSGTQLAFRAQDSDVRLAFERLAKSLEPTGAKLSDVAMSSIYPLTSFITEKVRAIRFEFYDRARPPASTMLLFEGLPSLDATFAVDVVAVAPGN